MLHFILQDVCTPTDDDILFHSTNENSGRENLHPHFRGAQKAVSILDWSRGEARESLEREHTTGAHSGY